MTGTENKTKILVVLPFLSGEGGTETVVNEWIKHFQASKNFDVQFLLPQGSMRENWIVKSEQVESFQFARFFKKWRAIRNLFGSLWLALKILFSSADEVVCLSTKLIFEVSFLKKFFRKQFSIVSWIHFSLKYGQDISLDDLKKADFHLAISSGIKKDLYQIGVSKCQVSVIGNPLSKASRKIPASEDGITRFMYSGRIFVDGQKNLRELITGLVKLNEYINTWTIDVFGDGPDMKVFTSLISQNGLKNHVIIHGWVDDPFKDLSHMDCLVLTSKYEGFGMVLAEAISYGIPVISSDCDTGPADIVNNSNGYLYTPGDVNGLAKSFIKIADKTKAFDHEELAKTVQQFYLTPYFAKLENALSNFY